MCPKTLLAFVLQLCTNQCCASGLSHQLPRSSDQALSLQPSCCRSPQTSLAHTRSEGQCCAPCCCCIKTIDFMAMSSLVNTPDQSHRSRSPRFMERRGVEPADHKDEHTRENHPHADAVTSSDCLMLPLMLYQVSSRSQS